MKSSKPSLSLSFCRAGTRLWTTRNHDIFVFRATSVTTLGYFQRWHVRCQSANQNGRMCALPHYFLVPSFSLSLCSTSSDVTSVEVEWLEWLPDGPEEWQRSCRKAVGGSRVACRESATQIRCICWAFTTQLWLPYSQQRKLPENDYPNFPLENSARKTCHYLFRTTPEVQLGHWLVSFVIFACTVPSKFNLECPFPGHLFSLFTSMYRTRQF